jgi:ectoine hydroxylase-related dioxygenase (phytanoyl-CoA dioxygenase family)
MRSDDNLERNGFSVVDHVLESQDLCQIAAELDRIADADGVRRRNGNVFGVRNLLDRVPSTRAIIEADNVRSLVERFAGDKAKPVRSLLFHKNLTANWIVPWHQDLTIAVRQRRAIAGFGPWTIKAGVTHVQPPISILEGIFTLRIHLDATDESNGALSVIPGSHEMGQLSFTAVRDLVTNIKPTLCEVSRGGALLMKPLLLHSSSSCKSTIDRRVLHFEFSADELPGGLEWYGS